VLHKAAKSEQRCAETDKLHIRDVAFCNSRIAGNGRLAAIRSPETVAAMLKEAGQDYAIVTTGR
jgi:hypothetical protein